MRPQSEVIRLTDGTAFAVFWRHGQIAVAAPHGDPVLAETLSRYGVGYDLAEGTTIHAGMSAETVRTYCRAHGGVVPGGGGLSRCACSGSSPNRRSRSRLRRLPGSRRPGRGRPSIRR